MKILYCWRCQAELPFLDDAECEIISPYYLDGIKQVQDYRAKTGATIPEAVLHRNSDALDKFFEMTGYRLKQFDDIHHHVLRTLGPICPDCGKPLRTPQATYCVECGAPKRT